MILMDEGIDSQFNLTKAGRVCFSGTLVCLLEPWDRNEAVLGRTGPRAPDLYTILQGRLQALTLPSLTPPGCLNLNHSHIPNRRRTTFLCPPKSREVRPGIKYKVSNLCHSRIAVLTLQKPLALPMP